MKNVFLLSFVLIAGFAFGQAGVAKKTSSGRGYLEYLPDDYDPEKTYHCIISLHSSGKGGTGSPSDLNKLRTECLPYYLEGNEGGLELPYIVLAPQQSASKNGYQGQNGSRGLVIPFIEEVRQVYHIDKIILTGFSMGGDGALWTGGSSDNINNDIYAAIAVAPANTNFNTGKACGTRKIPVKIFWGPSDSYYTSNTIIAHAQVVNGYLKAYYDIQKVVLASGTHSKSTWEKVYKADANNLNGQSIYDWIESILPPGPPEEPDPGIYINGQFVGTLADTVNFCNATVNIVPEPEP